MADEEWDMSGNTQQFQAFARNGGGEPAAPSGPNVGMIVGVAALVLVVAVAVAAFLLI